MLLLSKRYNGYCKLLKTLRCNNKLYVIYKMQRLRTFMEISNQKDKKKNQKQPAKTENMEKNNIDAWP